MLLLLALIFWITINGANVPSDLIAGFLFGIQDKLTEWLASISAPAWVNGLFVEGVYRTLAWVISVMLPPMAIFFPLFTLLEDSGYLPRIAFNMDKHFKKAGAHGKQSLTMCMGFGCNAAGGGLPDHRLAQRTAHRHSYQQLRPLQRPSSGPRNSDHAVFYRSFVRRSYFLSPSCPDPYFFYPYRCCRHLFCIPPSVCHGP